jgi:hypothetical protein
MPRFREGQILDADIMNESDLFSNFSPKDHSDNTSPAAGWVWYNSSTQRIEVYNGSLLQWDEIGPKAVEAAPSLDLTGDLTIGLDLVVTGNLSVNGTTFTANTQTVLIEDNVLLINNGEVGAGVTSGTAGIEIDRGSSTNYQFIFDETQDNFRVGTSGDTQAVATREDTPTDTAISFWNNSALRYDTDANLTWNTTTLGITGALSVSTTISAANIGVDTDNSVVILNSGGLLKTDEIDSKVWDGSLIDGSGTTNYIPKWSDADSLTNSIIYDDGTNVGIGIVAPTAKLATAGVIQATRTAFSDPTGVGGLEISFRTDDKAYIDSFDRDAVAYRPLIFGASSYYFADGNVGIGIDDPDYRLYTVHATLPFHSVSTDGATAVNNLFECTDQTSVTNTLVQIKHAAGDSASYKLLHVTGRDSLNMLTILGNGNVGIGTDSPSVNLEIFATNPRFAMVEDSNHFFGIDVDIPDESNTALYTDISRGLVFGAKAVHTDAALAEEWARFDSAGKFGIGITPGAYLHVFHASTNRVGLFESGDPTASIAFVDSNTADSSSVEIGAVTDDLFLKAGGTERVRVDSSGNVGIGTASPSVNADLTLEGGVLCIKETTTPTADTDYGKVYTKADNKLYFQDGTGVEHEIALV